MGFFLQLKLLLWKNFTLRKRQPVRVVIEIVWPLMLFLILVWVKLDNTDLQIRRHECHFDGKAMPSAGIVPFFQSVLCTANNTCHKTPRTGEAPGHVNILNASVLSELMSEVEARLDDVSNSDIFENLMYDLETIKQLKAVIEQCNFKIEDFMKDSSQLSNLLSQQNITLSPQSLEVLLASRFNISELVSYISTKQWSASGVGPRILQQSICEEDLLEHIIVSPVGAKRERLKNELCNLTSIQFGTLLNDVYRSLDRDLIQEEATRCVTEKLGVFGAFNMGLRILQMRSHYTEALKLVNKFNQTLNLATKVLHISNLPPLDTPSVMNSSNWILQTISTVLCQSSSVLDKSFQEKDDYLGRMAEMQKSSEDDVKLENQTSFSSDFTYDNTTSYFCNDIFYRIQQFQNPAVRMVWFQMKPLVRGKIPYSPDTQVVRRIIHQANWTFEYLARIQKMAKDSLEGLPMIEQFMTSSPVMDNIRVALFAASLAFPDSKEIENLFYWTQNQPGSTNFSNWQYTLNLTEKVMTFVSTYFECFQFDKFEPFRQESDLVKASLKYIENQLLWAGLVFETGEKSSLNSSDSRMPSHITFKIRMDSDRVDSTRKLKVTDKYWSPGPRAKAMSDMKYIISGFAYLQDLIEHAIIREQTGKDDIGISVQQFPYPCYIDDRFTLAISRSLPLFMTLAWIFSVAMIVKGIVYEKEQRLKEVMKVMGLGNDVHWVSWLLTSFITMLLSVSLLVLVLKGGKVLEYSDGLVVFVFMLMFSLATIMQCFMFSVFFSKANLAAACAAIFYFIGYLPYALCIQWEDYMVQWQKALACLSSTVAFGFGCSYIARYEQQGIGIQWYNVPMSPIPEDSFSLAHCIGMMMIDIVIYFVITWYVEAVFPGQFGVPKPWYFCFTKSYWCGRMYSTENTVPVNPNIELHSNQEASGMFESEPKHLKLGVAIKGLQKVYSNGRRLAVDNLDLNFYEGQITSFLGHNGAGKTTTMSILTGLFPPTQGTAFVYGKDIRFDMDEIHKDMGMCPQHNVLFDRLTVEEHLYFYSSLKGMRKEAQEEEMKKMIEDVGLPHKRLALAGSLSGGMKRKLSIAVAFTAGSRIVILDEPTAGVDPYARRSIWDLLLKYRAGRTIILSTHFMDEADILGDRIAIISQGKLCCCGSSLFLKSLFGSGYYLTFSLAGNKRKQGQLMRNGAERDVNGGRQDGSRETKAADRREKDGDSDDEMLNVEVTLDTSDVDLTSGSATSVNHSMHNNRGNWSIGQETVLMDLIRSHIRKAKLVENLSSELTVQLPDDKQSVTKFDKLFADIDKQIITLGISGYGISNTTLEEVFLKVAKMSEIDEENEETERLQLEMLTDGGSFARPITRLSFGRARRRFLGMIRRKREPNGLLNDDLLNDEVVAQFPESFALLGRPSFSQEVVEDYVIGESASSGDVSMSADDGVGACNGPGAYRVSGAALVGRQFWALFVKRFHYVRRSKKAFLSQIVLPAIFICLAMIFSKINPPMADLPPMELHPWLMVPKHLNDTHLYVFYSKDDATAKWPWTMERLLMEKPGLGTRCMDPEVYTIQDFPCEMDDVIPQLNSPSVAENEGQNCSCDTGYQQCPAGASGPEPVKFLLPTTDFLYNMTDQNIRDWLLKTTHTYRLKRYGGLSFGEKNDMVQVNKTQLEALVTRILSLADSLGSSSVLPSNQTMAAIVENVQYLFSRLAISQNAKIWFDNTGYVSMVSYMNVMNNLLLRANLEPGSNLMKYGISAVNHPMNRTKAQLAEYTIRASGADALIAISVIFALSQIPASFVLFLIEERQSGSKHLQFVSGVNPTVYWLVNFCWDMCNYMVCATICIFLFMAFQQKEYVSAANAPCLVALLFLYGWAITPMMYPASYIFSVPSTAFVVMGCINIFIGIVSTISTFILELFMEERLDRINAILRKVFLILPHFCLGRGLIDMTRNQLIADVFTAFGEDLFKNPLNWDIVGKNLFCLTLLGVFFFIITLCIEYKFWYYKLPCFKTRLSGRRMSTTSEQLLDEDVDVASERNRVVTGQTDADVLTVQGLTKVYSNMFSQKLFLAVNNITLGVKKGECFGLLGVNGAGKTTTFKMLTGELAVTSGNAHLSGYSILTDMLSVHQHLGYCPQFDALCSLLTPTEHLEMYARLRGVLERDVSKVAKWAIHRLGLVTHQNKCAGDLSGGNKRKLSTAIALVGNPSVVFLDEPTTGMDPKARRFLWNCINSIKRDGRSVVLTSHSMEECEALCDRIAIMVNGTFQCLGSIQHLKTRFGDGYTVMIRMSGEQPKLSPLEEFISETFPESLLKEEHHNMLHYHFTSTRIPLSFIFGTLESVRARFGIEDYSVCQTTLDQVFINFAKLQTEVQNDEQEVANVNGRAENQST